MSEDKEFEDEGAENTEKAPQEPQEGVVVKKYEKKDGSDADMKAIDFRVALALSELGFGAMYTAKHLLRSRGMVQSWKKMGEKHHLARKNFNDDKVTNRLWKIRRVTTFKNLDYHLAGRLFEYDLSSSYIARKLGIPVSTVNSWRKGNSPASVRNGFIDKELVESKFESLLDTINFCRSLSYQRKAGMSWLSPYMMPAWQAEV